METREGLVSLGPLADPWHRYGGNPAVSPRGEERSIQNGPQTILRYRGRWVTLAPSFIESLGHITVAQHGMALSYSTLAP